MKLAVKTGKNSRIQIFMPFMSRMEPTVFVFFVTIHTAILKYTFKFGIPLTICDIIII